ncbi:MAG: excinuclease ABC subunit UvrC [Fibrobacteria bacterium]|nr:excinuclease ABC subunit UvrC [Fibrobacteria bacterium]
MPLSSKIQSRLEQLPATPGVYLMKDRRGKIIYIGKAISLRNRVRSYFLKSTSNNHLAAHVLKEKASDIEWIVVHKEIEALILEANLINKHKPRYNIDLKDDKHYPYLMITLSESFPRLVITRKVSSKQDIYFGPYTEGRGRALRQAMNTVYRVFRIRDCKLTFPLKKKIDPCLSYHIGRCDAPCAGLCAEKDYRQLVQEAILFLKGRHKDLMKSFTTEMKKASKSMQYEKAGKIRDQINDMELLFQKQKMDLGKLNVPRDLIAVVREGKIASAVVLKIRDGVVIDRRSYELTSPLDQDENAIITHFLKNFYREKEEVPRELILSHAPLEEENLETALRELRNTAVTIEVPVQGDKKKQVNLTMSNAKVLLVEYIARKEKKNRIDYSVQALQEDLGLEITPKRIEAFDISHLGGTDTVASMVVFVDGKPRKSEYRKYIIKTVKGVDDFASMREVISRRVRRLQEEEKNFPELFLVDGGKGQLSAAVETLEAAGCSTQLVIGLAKRLEEVFKPGAPESYLIPKSSASLKLIQKIRNESHRFAITFQRSKRKKYVTKTWLHEVPGIGPKTIEKLLKQFKSPGAVKKATAEELATCLGNALGNKINDYIQKQTRLDL